MSSPSAPAGIAIVGPTASGKTALAIEVARRVEGEVISMDSRQVYRGMDIGTAKATAAQQRAVPHHGIDLVDPGERFSAGRFARYARERIAGIRARHRTPILAGGTGFFLRALTHPIFRQPELDPARREALQKQLEALPLEQLAAWLGEVDPESAARFAGSGGGGGRQRVQRALELALLTGRPLSWWHRHAPPEAPPLAFRVFVLDLPRELLFGAIDRRVGEMLDAGLLEEVRSLREAGFGAGDPGMNATGYVELLPVLEGEASLEEAAERVRRNTRAYARRQLTWLRHQLPRDAVWLDATRPVEALADAIAEDWREAAAGGVSGAGEPADDNGRNDERRDAE